MFHVKAIFAATLAACLTSPAVACEPDLLTRSEAKRADTPIKIRPDCSFKDTDAGKILDYWSTSDEKGNPVRDRGNGRVAQVLTVSGFCSVQQALLFIDCNAGESLIIYGKGSPPSDVEVAGAILSLVETIQPPYGPIKIGPQSTVSILAKVANKHGISTTSPAEYFAQSSPRDSYDPTCGCKLFYPESLGAQQQPK